MRKMREERSRKTQEVVFDRQKVKSHKKDVTARGKVLKDVKTKLCQLRNDVTLADDTVFGAVPAGQADLV